MKKWLLTLGLALLASPCWAASPWKIDPNHSAAQFVVRHLGISSVRGQFTKVEGSLELDEEDVGKSSVSVTVPTDSVDTRVPARDADLRSDHFFDVAKYPTMTFKSTRIVRAPDGRLQMSGDLTLHGVTHAVTFEVDGPSEAISGPGGKARRGASASATIKRSDFGMNYLQGPVSDEVGITIDVEFVKQP